MDLGRFSDQSAQPGLAVNKLLKLKVITPRIDEQNEKSQICYVFLTSVSLPKTKSLKN